MCTVIGLLFQLNNTQTVLAKSHRQLSEISSGHDVNSIDSVKPIEKGRKLPFNRNTFLKNLKDSFNEVPNLKKLKKRKHRLKIRKKRKQIKIKIKKIKLKIRHGKSDPQ